jgi:hypothetical protein
MAMHLTKPLTLDECARFTAFKQHHIQQFPARLRVKMANSIFEPKSFNRNLTPELTGELSTQMIKELLIASPVE